MIKPTLIAAVFLFLASCIRCFAGGSIGWDEVRVEIMREDPALLTLIETRFDMKRVGGAMRVGRDASGNATIPELGVGARIPPYEFYAKPKGDPGDYTLYMIFAQVDRTGKGKPSWQVTITTKLPGR